MQHFLCVCAKESTFTHEKRVQFCRHRDKSTTHFERFKKVRESCVQRTVNEVSCFITHPLRHSERLSERVSESQRETVRDSEIVPDETTAHNANVLREERQCLRKWCPRFHTRVMRVSYSRTLTVARCARLCIRIDGQHLCAGARDTFSYSRRFATRLIIGNGKHRFVEQFACASISRVLTLHENCIWPTSPISRAPTRTLC